MDKLTYLVCAILMLNLMLNNCKCDDSVEGSHKKNTTAGSRYCGNSLVRAMRLICEGYYAEPNLKRSLEYNEPKRRPNRRNKIWKRKFNIKDSDLFTWTELDSQYETLFGSEVHQDSLPYTGFYSLPIRDDHLNGGRFKRSSEQQQQNESNNLRRGKRGIYESCCEQPCTVKYMKSYCLNT